MTIMRGDRREVRIQPAMALLAQFFCGLRNGLHAWIIFVFLPGQSREGEGFKARFCIISRIISKAMKRVSGIVEIPPCRFYNELHPTRQCIIHVSFILENCLPISGGIFRNERKTGEKRDKISARISLFTCFGPPHMGVLFNQPGPFRNCPRKGVNLFWARAIICPLPVNIDQVASPRN